MTTPDPFSYEGGRLSPRLRRVPSLEREGRLPPLRPSTALGAPPLRQERNIRRQIVAVFVIVMLVASFVYFWRLGTSSIANADEGVHALVTREVRESGDWLTLHLRGVNYFRKPPFSFWVRAATQNILGESEFTTRLPSALAGVGTTLLLAWWAWLWTRRWLAALAAGIIFPLLPITFTHTFRTGETDGILIFLLTLAGFLLWRSLRKPWLIVAAAGVVGLAFMTKSVAAGVVPIGFGLALLLGRRWRYTWKQVVLAVAAFLLVAAPWHVYEYQKHRQAFWKEYVEFHILQRVEERLHVTPKTHGPFWYALAVEQGMFPWSWLVLPAAGAALLRLKRKQDSSLGLEFLLAWGFGTVVLFSLAATKLAWYVAPAYPALTLLVAWFLVEGIRGSPRWLKVLTAASAAAYVYRAFEFYRTGASKFLSFAWLDARTATALVAAVVALILFTAYRRSPEFGRKALAVVVMLTLTHMVLVNLVIVSRNLKRVYESPYRVFRNAMVARDPKAAVFIYDIGYYTSPLSYIYIVGQEQQRVFTPLKEKRDKLETILKEQSGAFVIFERSRILDRDVQERLDFVSAYGALSLYQVIPKKLSLP